MRKTTNRLSRPAGTVLAAALLVLLAGCTEPQKPVTECEPGVAGLSGSATLVPGSC